MTTPEQAGTKPAEPSEHLTEAEILSIYRTWDGRAGSSHADLIAECYALGRHRALKPSPEHDLETFRQAVIARGRPQYGRFGSRDIDISADIALYEAAVKPSPEPAPRNSVGETPTEHAHRWATELAIHMAKKFYPEVTQWRPSPDLLGVIMQLDNMTCGLMRAPEPSPEPAVAEPTTAQFEKAMRAIPCPDHWTFQDDGTGGFHNHATEWAWIAYRAAKAAP